MPYDPPPHVTQHWRVTKPAATGRRGMVVAQARDAAEAGVAVLDAGGNAVDAAVAHSLLFVEGFGMDVEAAAHHPRIDVSGPEGVTADRRLGADVLDALRADGPVEVVEHAVIPVNFACPNMIVQRGGERIGVTDAMSPWSAAVAQG